MILKKIFLRILLIYLVICFPSSILYSKIVKISFKIDNEIITNTDIKNETKYLTALNNDLENLSDSELNEISKSSLIKEKIKEKELKKHLNIDEYNNEKLINNIIDNFQNKLKLNNKEEFVNYLKEYDLTINDIIKKIKIEILWNQLIAELYKNQIVIDENKIKKKIKEENLNLQKYIEYDLSEILFELKENKNLNETYEEIKQSISQRGFEVTANKYSLSDSNKFGGKIGLIDENQLSKIINDKLKKLDIGNYTDPIKIPNGYLILRINEKKVINQELDQEMILKKLVNYEKNKQYDQFSKIYFNKIKINSKIDG